MYLQRTPKTLCSKGLRAVPVLFYSLRCNSADDIIIESNRSNPALNRPWAMSSANAARGLFHFLRGEGKAMARVTLDEEIWLRIEDLRKFLKIKKADALLMVVNLYRSTQAYKETKIHPSLLRSRCGVDPRSPLSDSRLTQGLLVSHLVSTPELPGDDCLVIRGNEKHIANIENSKKAGKLGGLASGESRRKTKQTLQAVVEHRAEQSRAVNSPLPPEGDLGASESSSPEENSGPSPADLARVWNEHSGPLPKVADPERMNEGRKRAARKRLSECPDLDVWKRMAQALGELPFANGESASGWRADFNYFCRPDTMVSFLEGSRIFGQKQALPPRPRQVVPLYRSAAEVP